MKKLKPLKILVQEAKTIRHKKYSNETLFERREKEKQQEKELISTKKNSTSTISNFFKYKNSLPQITSSTLAQSHKNNTKYSTSLNSDTIYLTNINFSQTINSDNTFSFKNINQPNSPNKIFNFNIKILNNFEDKVNSQKPKDEKTQIDIKNNTMHIIKERYKEYINKTRELQLLRYSMNIKKENVIRLKETYQNKIKSLDESIQSLNISKKLFNEQFYNKFDFYVKYLFIRKENEKEINNELIKEIIKLKSEIYQIETKIKKQEMDKNNIIRWLYFQISVKEKFIELPSHYKILIEENDLSFQYKNPKKRESKIIEENSKSFYRKNSQFKRAVNQKFSKKLRFSKIHIGEFKSSTLVKNLSQSEIERIKDYRIKPPFTTVDSFIETIKKYEDINIYKIKVYNELRDDLRNLKIEKLKLQKFQKEEDDIQNREINEKMNKLNRMIEKNNILLKERIYCENLKNQSSFDLNMKNKRIKRFDLSHSKPRLREHVQQLYSTCQLMDFDKIISPEIFVIKKIKTKEEEILDMLTKIEIVIVYIKNQFSLYNNSNGIYYDTYKKVMSVIDKDHKIAKAKRQREKEMIKLKKKMEQIEEKSKKLYFLRFRKTNDYLKYENNNENKKYYDDDNIYNEPVFEDFLYDINEKRSHSEEKKKKKKRKKTIKKQ